MAERKNPNEATTQEIQQYFGMTASAVMRDWKELSEDERMYFRVAVAEAIDNA